MTKSVLGIIGGSGIYDLPRLTNAQSKTSPWAKHRRRCSPARSKGYRSPAFLLQKLCRRAKIAPRREPGGNAWARK
jgi:purine nucleoside phosphorylase